MPVWRTVHLQFWAGCTSPFRFKALPLGVWIATRAMNLMVLPTAP